MTPKKNIVRKLTDTLPDGTLLDVSAFRPDFTPKEARFIAWYTHPGSEAFLNAGRAAIRAGYKQTNAVMQGYLLKQKPRIAEVIKNILPSVEDNLTSIVWRIWNLARIRMFYDIADFYRTFPYKQIIKIGKRQTVEFDTWDFEIIPLGELSWKKRMCIDGINYIGPQAKTVYILPNRDKEFKIYMECSALLFPDMFERDPFLRAMAAAFKAKIKRRKGIKGTAAYLRGE
ncbi:hypothetical protein AGMMS49587_16040 [Spirochaetia bacterium]|nr:hypothetical protein AGMMS49587_16040 [Spirochaetia bacterium]